MSSWSRSSTPTMGLSNGMLVINHGGAAGDVGYSTQAAAELLNRMLSLSCF